MRIFRDLDTLPDELCRGAVSIGNFDGVHRGHARIVERLMRMAEHVSGPAVVFTFDPHPVRILRPDETPDPLTWTERKAELLGRLGVQAMIAYPTDEELLRLSPEDFFQRIVLQRLRAGAMVEGSNFYFGRGRAGNVEKLAELAGSAGVELEVVPPVEIDGEPVSSSRVRRLLAAGEVAAACRLLTEPYRIRGLVVHGARRGEKIGFPTANLEAIETLLPGLGVYAGRAWIDGESWPAAVNVGPNPTFGESARKVEVHLIGFSGSLYGQPLEVDFLRRLREIRAFPGVEALKEQLGRDIAAAAEIARDWEMG